MSLHRPALPPSLLAHIQRRQMLERALRANLPGELATHVFLLNVRAGSLVLACDTQALITPLRFHAPALLEAARGLLGKEAPVRVAWRTLAIPPAKAFPRHPQRPSPACADAVEQAARCIADEKLGDALRGLARGMRGDK
ncbi:MAG: DciA family protein [Pseudomonadota bacterium]